MVIALYNLCERYGTCSDENNTDVNNYATSTIHKYLNETYYNTLPTQDREKLGTKAVQEEFHGENNATFQLLYNWNSMNVNVWLPSLSELVGIDLNNYNTDTGTYFSTMQGLNISGYWYVDAQGGNQFTYFQQFNASGGGERIWVLGGNEQFWTRSSVYANQEQFWRITNAERFDWTNATGSAAVHPAVLYNPERPVKQTAFLCFYRRIICLYLME